MTFPARKNEIWFLVYIKDDTRIEGTETFYIDLTIPSASADRSVILDPNSSATASVKITDASSECWCMKFVATASTVTGLLRRLHVSNGMVYLYCWYRCVIYRAPFLTGSVWSSPSAAFHIQLSLPYFTVQ